MGAPGGSAFDDRILGLMESWRVPGCAVAVVRIGETILSRGYGVRGVNDPARVGPDTLFGIASATKSFTATAVGMLVDEGRLSWDQPLREVLPDLRMPSRLLTEQVTAEDLLSHRTGLPYYLPWWVHTPLSRAELVRRYRHLVTVEGFRARFRYNNLGYILAGHLVDRLSGAPWERFLRDRIFEPLGMRRTTASMEEAATATDGARPHRIVDGRLEEAPIIPFGAAGPCGGICSTAADMARWLGAQLGRGSRGAARLLREPTHERMTAAVIPVPGTGGMEGLLPADYGLGWWIQGWRGELMVHHAGDYYGMCSHVSFLPARGLAVAVLANAQSSSLPDIAAYGAYETLLGLPRAPWDERFRAARERAGAAPGAPGPERPGASPSLPLPAEAYAGSYEHPVFGRCVARADAASLTFTYNGLEYPLRPWQGDTLAVEGWQLHGRFRQVAFERRGNRIVAARVVMDPEVAEARFRRGTG